MSLTLRRPLRGLRIMSPLSDSSGSVPEGNSRPAAAISRFPSVVAVIKPYGMKVLSESLEVSGEGSQVDVNDVEDCLYNRLHDTLGTLLPAATSGGKPQAWYMPHFHNRQHPLRPSRWSRGLQLCIADAEDTAYFRNCADLGLVLRKYLALVHLPACTTIEDEPQAGGNSPLLSSESKLNKYIQRAKVEKSERHLTTSAGRGALFESVPACVPPCSALLRRGMLDSAGRLRLSASVECYVCPATDRTPRSDQLERLAGLFSPTTGKSRTGELSPAHARPSRVDLCQRVECCHYQPQSLPTNPDALLPVPHTADIPTARRCEFKYQLIGCTPKEYSGQRLALLELQTTSAYENELCCLLAYSGFPVVGDHQHNAYFRAMVNGIHSTNPNDMSLKVQKSKGKGTGKEQTLESKLESFLAMQGQGPDHLRFIGLGLSLCSVSFPAMTSDNKRRLNLVRSMTETFRRKSPKPVDYSLFGLSRSAMELEEYRYPTTDHFFHQVVRGEWDGIRNEWSEVPDLKSKAVKDSSSGDERSSMGAVVPFASNVVSQLVNPTLGELRTVLQMSSPTTPNLRGLIGNKSPGLQRYTAPVSKPDLGLPRRQTLRCSLCGGGHHTDLCPKNENVKEGFAAARVSGKSIRATMQSDPSGFFCIMCGELGHWYPTCPLRENSRPTSVNRCPICHEEADHRTVDCPARFPVPKGQGFLKMGIHSRHSKLLSINRQPPMKAKSLFREVSDS